MNKKRILAIELEAAEPTLLEKWAKWGHLPSIAKLMETGTYSRMWGPAEVSSGATGSSISCGVTPGKHGMGFCHRQFLNGTNETRKKRADEVNCKPFWIQLDRNGKEIAVMDVPETKMKILKVHSWLDGVLNFKHDILLGWREKKKDALFLRKIPSKIANSLISLVTGNKVKDAGRGAPYKNYLTTIN